MRDPLERPPVPTVPVVPARARRLFAAAILAGAIGVAAGAAEAATSTVQAKNFAFAPDSLMIDVGDTVGWTFSGDPHTVTSGAPGAIDGRFDSGIVSPGGSFSLTFTTQGTYPYFCQIHPEQMRATITVTAVATPSPTPTPTPTPTTAPRPSATPRPTPKPSTKPSPAPSPTATPTAAPSPATTAVTTLEPSSSPSPSSEPSPAPEVSPSSEPSPTPEVSLGPAPADLGGPAGASPRSPSSGLGSSWPS